MKKILFVDDEPAILQGLRGRLYHKRREWDMTFAEGGAVALQALEDSPYDVVVTDLRMPDVDGAQLLETASRRWPQTVRIVLSGYSEQEQAVRVVRYAHQYLSKPCAPQQLENVIERCLKLQALFQDERLRALVGRIHKLPAVPKTYARLCEAMARPDVSAEEVAHIVSQDMAISARLLQVVNSAFFRLARQITRIEQAVTYLGFTAVRNLVMSMEVFSQWTVTDKIGFDPQELQAHARQVAAAARALTEKTPLADDAMLAGMLHDIGYLILAQECPRELAVAIAEHHQSGEPLYRIEQRIFGASHAEIGAYLLGIWGLPYPVVEAVAHHHQPQRVQQQQFDVLAAVVLAESLVLTAPNGAVCALDMPQAIVDESYLRTLEAPFEFTEARNRVSERLEGYTGAAE